MAIAPKFEAKVVFTGEQIDLLKRISDNLEGIKELYEDTCRLLNSVVQESVQVKTVENEEEERFICWRCDKDCNREEIIFDPAGTKTCKICDEELAEIPKEEKEEEEILGCVYCPITSNDISKEFFTSVKEGVWACQSCASQRGLLPRKNKRARVYTCARCLETVTYESGIHEKERDLTMCNSCIDFLTVLKKDTPVDKEKE